MYCFAAVDRHDYDDIANEGGQQPPLSSFKSFIAFINRRENQSLAVCGLWMTTIEASVAIGNIHTSLTGNHFYGWFCLSMIFWLNPPLIYFASRLRNVISQMSPSGISSYLSTNILTIGISLITPMIYVSLDTIKCASNANHTQNVYEQCSGVSFPQLSICFFLLFMMAVKVLIAPLSNTTLTANDLIKLNIPRRIIIEGTLFCLSFLFNLYLFANKEEGKVTDSIKALMDSQYPHSLTIIPRAIQHDILPRPPYVHLPPSPSSTHISPLWRNLPLPHRQPLPRSDPRRRNRRLLLNLNISIMSPEFFRFPLI